MGFEEESVYMLDPSRFQNGKDGPCHSNEFRKQFWTDVLKNLKLNLWTLIEKGRQINEKKRHSELLREEYDPNYEEKIQNLIKVYAPNSIYLKSDIISKLGLSTTQVKELAEELEMGMICYVNKETKEIACIPEDYSEGIVDPDPWEELNEQLEENPDQYWKIRKMDSRESFMVMERFADQLTNDQLKANLYQALNMRRPFRNFKNVIDDAGEYREEWV
jgi:hypothetical protein